MMYTVDDNTRNEIEDEYIETGSWNNKTGLIIKIIIIILCVLVLIWLIKSLKTSNYKTDNGEIHAANVLKVRLASEEYFFLKNKKDNVKEVSLNELKSMGLTSEIIDANHKTCNGNNTKAILDKGNNNYIMTIKLSCSTNDKEEVFYYQGTTLACQNCNGKTIMTGNTVVADKTNEDKKSSQEENGGNKNDDNDVPSSNDESGEYSCVNWTSWSKNRINDASLTERTKTLVQGVKYGDSTSKTVYGEWSEWTTNKITSSDTLEVETKVEYTTGWSKEKTSDYVDVNNKNIKIISINENTVNNVNCPSNYIKDNDKCYSRYEHVGNLTYSEFNSGKYKVNNGLCERVRTLKNNQGKYELTYINCRYNDIIKSDNIETTKTYTYQELVSRSITYYRSRSITTVVDKESDIYTTEKYEESDLPEGYVKVPGTEEVLYSYKLTYCEK